MTSRHLISVAKLKTAPAAAAPAAHAQPAAPTRAPVLAPAHAHAHAVCEVGADAFVTVKGERELRRERKERAGKETTKAKDQEQHVDGETERKISKGKGKDGKTKAAPASRANGPESHERKAPREGERKERPAHVMEIFHDGKTAPPVDGAPPVSLRFRSRFCVVLNVFVCCYLVYSAGRRVYHFC